MGLNFSFWQSLVQATLGSLCISLSWPKDPLRVKMKEEIGKEGKAKNHDISFPLPTLLFYFIFISFNSLFSSLFLLSYSTFTLN
jgi:hypothetical protein